MSARSPAFRLAATGIKRKQPAYLCVDSGRQPRIFSAFRAHPLLALPQRPMLRPIGISIPLSTGELDSRSVFAPILTDVTHRADKLKLARRRNHDLRIYLDWSVHAHTHTIDADIGDESNMRGASRCFGTSGPRSKVRFFYSRRRLLL